MQSYVVVETDDGLTVVEVDESTSAELEAERYGGVIADPTPYATYEDAFDALLMVDAEMKSDSDFRIE